MKSTIIKTCKQESEYRNNCIARDDIPSLSEMEVDGEVRNLGIVKHFKSHPPLSKLLPPAFAIAWVHLDPDEVLEVHSHNVASLIISAQGLATSQGDSNISFSSGDIVLIPAWNEHGFTGGHPDGLWALSIQFNEVAIFESDVDPLTTYHLDEKPSIEERQLVVYGREQGVNNPSLSHLTDLIPSHIHFEWQKVDRHFVYTPSHDQKTCLMIVCSLDYPVLVDGNVMHEGSIVIVKDVTTMTALSEPANAWVLVVEFEAGEE